MNNMLRRTKQINWEGLGKRMRTHGLSNYGPLGNNLCKWKSRMFSQKFGFGFRSQELWLLVIVCDFAIGVCLQPEQFV